MKVLIIFSSLYKRPDARVKSSYHDIMTLHIIHFVSLPNRPKTRVFTYVVGCQKNCLKILSMWCLIREEMAVKSK
jgi:hypothetical protein